MEFPLTAFEVRPTPGNPRGRIFRPMVPVVVCAPGARIGVVALVDSGADETVLPLEVARAAGVSLGRTTYLFRGVGGQEVRVRYGTVTFEIRGSRRSYQWHHRVGFLPSLKHAILGYAGFLEFFTFTHWSLLGTFQIAPHARFPRGEGPGRADSRRPSVAATA